MDFIHNSSISENASKHTKKTSASGPREGRREKGAIQKVEKLQEEFLNNLFLVEKRLARREGPTGDKFEKTQYIQPLRAIQKRRFSLSEISSGAKRFPWQDRSQKGLFCNFSQQTVIKISEIQVVRQPLRVSVPFFWFRVSSKSFYQITKNPNCSFETNKHSNNCLSARYIADGEDLTGNYESEGYIDFSVVKFGICHKSEKVNPTTSESIGISGVTDKYKRNNTVS